MSGSTLALVRQNIVEALYLYAAAGLENGLEWLQRTHSVHS